MNIVRRVIADLRFYNTPRAKRLNEVRGLDENSAKYRRVMQENKAEVAFHLSQVAKARREAEARRG